LTTVHHLEVVILSLLGATAALAIVANAVQVPYPIVLVAGGAAVGFVPGMPELELAPELVLLIFLPPLLYGAAFFSSLRDLRRNVGSIGLLAVGLVLVTMAAVAVVAHLVIGLSWEVAFVLGAIVAPTDAVAPAEIVRRLGAPRRIVTVIEGENLTNDWTALALYKFAVAAVVSGSFSAWEAGPEFLLTGIGGIAIGLLVGRLIREVRYRLDDPPLEISISLFSGYFAYLPAEALGASGVIAAVTTGIYMGWYTPILTTAVVRIQGVSVWEILTFLLNALLFLLVGLQLPGILDDLSGFSTGELIGWAALVSAVVIAVRIAWVFLVAARTRDPFASTAVIAWSGMRGAVSLAAALAIPVETAAGAPFPERELLIFLALAVIGATLVGQGLTLGPLIDALDLEDDHGAEEEETLARIRIAEAATARLDELEGADWINEDTRARAYGLYRYRQRRFGARLESIDGGDEEIERRSSSYRKLMLKLLASQREALLELRNSGEISDEVRRTVERDLDLEESRLG
jgi:CPA1 family monovalent cation:H+ antiporter